MNVLRLLALSTIFLFACGDDDGATDAGGTDAGRSDTGGDDAGGDDAGGDDAGGDDAGDDAGGDDAGGDAGGPMCGDVVEVASVEELVALAPTSYGRAAFESQWATSADIRATASFTVMSSDFEAPDDCVAPECATMVSPSVRGDVPGVTRSTNIDIESDALFRMRFNVQFLPPVSDFALVVFEKACALDCGDLESRCPEDDSCYQSGRQYCRACDHESAMRCACVDTDGSDRPEGTECTYITGDIGNVGTCMDGICSSAL